MRKLIFRMLFVLFISCMCLGIYYVDNQNPIDYYSKAYQLDFNNNYKRIYSVDTGTSFNGDGDYYEVYKTNGLSKDELSYFNKSYTEEYSFNLFLDELNCDIDYYPKINEQSDYLEIRKNNHIELRIVYSYRTKYLYILRTII